MLALEFTNYVTIEKCSKWCEENTLIRSELSMLEINEIPLIEKTREKEKQKNFAEIVISFIVHLAEAHVFVHVS